MFVDGNKIWNGNEDEDNQHQDPKKEGKEGNNNILGRKQKGSSCLTIPNGFTCLSRLHPSPRNNVIFNVFLNHLFFFFSTWWARWFTHNHVDINIECWLLCLFSFIFQYFFFFWKREMSRCLLAFSRVFNSKFIVKVGCNQRINVFVKRTYTHRESIYFITLFLLPFEY